MNSNTCLCKSSIGLKILHALTGIILIGFIIGHIAGNLLIFVGPNALNEYAKFLQDNIGVLWVARVTLLAAFFLHIAIAIKLKAKNSAARPVAYKHQNTVQASFSSRIMMQSGLIILGFVIIHLLHFTFGKLQPEYYHQLDQNGLIDVYSMVILGFQNELYAIGYIFCMLFIGFHLSHAIASVFQTLGLAQDPNVKKRIENASRMLGAVIALLYISIPAAVLIGFLGV